MDAAIRPLVEDPTVGYRLDPDEPGVAKPARASRSVYTVVGQESRNRARLKAKAMQQGQDILLVKTEYKVRKVGSYLVAVGGETTVITRDRPESQTAAEALGPKEKTPDEPMADGSTTRRVAELRAEQQHLEIEQRRLERADQGQSPYDAEQTKLRLRAVERQLKDIDEELKRLGAVSGSASLAYAANGVAESLGAVGRLLDLVI